jgi:CHASE2 domain-containing sensor protein
MTPPVPRRTQRLFSAALLVFALVSLLWFGLSFAATAQLLADGSMRDRAHVRVGYVDAAVEGAAVAGWLWALFASARSGSPVNGPVQVMCGVTIAAQGATLLSMAALMGGWSWDGPAGLLLSYAAVAALLMILLRNARSRATADGA